VKSKNCEPINVEDRKVLTKGWRKRRWEMLLKGEKISDKQDE
jgi:hypothetical protein